MKKKLGNRKKIFLRGICFAFIEKSLPQNSKKQAHIFPGSIKRKKQQKTNIHLNKGFDEGIF
jgi:hypothetical protein